jgi:hypothetical protein
MPRNSKENIVSPVLDLSRKHYSRLRFYWQGRSQGVHGQMDGIE